jgi:hypothetical protein
MRANTPRPTIDHVSVTFRRYLVRVSERGTASSATADAMQAEHFRNILERERTVLRSHLSKQVKHLNAIATSGQIRTVSQARQSIRITQHSILSVERMLAALDQQFPVHDEIRRRA